MAIFGGILAFLGLFLTRLIFIFFLFCFFAHLVLKVLKKKDIFRTFSKKCSKMSSEKNVGYFF